MEVPLGARPDLRITPGSPDPVHVVAPAGAAAEATCCVSRRNNSTESSGACGGRGACRRDRALHALWPNHEQHELSTSWSGSQKRAASSNLSTLRARSMQPACHWRWHGAARDVGVPPWPPTRSRCVRICIRVGHMSHMCQRTIRQAHSTVAVKTLMSLSELRSRLLQRLQLVR